MPRLANPETTYPQILGRIIAGEREKKGWNQEEMAKKVGINRSSWSRIESGKTIPNAVQIERIARALGITSADIFKDTHTAQIDLESQGVKVLDESPSKSSGNRIFWGLAAGVLAGLVASALTREKSDD